MSKKNNKALIKAKESKAILNKYMLAPSFLKSKQLLLILQKTPREHVYTREGKGNQSFDYVTGVYIKKVLNYAFGWLWDFEVKDKGREEKQIWVLGRLTIKDKKGNSLITKEQFGRADIKFYKDKTKGMLDYGNDLKAAATDALKKCASELGIASDIYGSEEFKEIKKEATKIGGQKVTGLYAGPKEKTQIEKLCKEMGVEDPDKAYELIEKLTGIELNFNQLTRVQASTIIATLLQKQTAKRNGKN